MKTGWKKMNSVISVLKRKYCHIEYFIPKLAFFFSSFFYVIFVIAGFGRAYNHTWMFSVWVLFGGGALLFAVPLSSLGRYLPVSIPMSVLFLLQMSVKELVKYSPFRSVIMLAGYLLLLFISVLVIVSGIFHLVLERKVRSEKECPTALFIVLDALYLLLIISFVAANYPFRPADDAMSVFNSIVENKYSDWHTIGYQTFVRFCLWLGKPVSYHPFSVIVIQSLMWLLIQVRISRILQKLFSVNARAVYLLMNLIIFTPVTYLGIMMKDVVFSMCVLAFCAELFYFLYTQERTRTNRVLLFIYAIGVAEFRHAAVWAVLVSLLLTSIYLIRKKESGRRFLLIIAALVFLIFEFMVHIYGYRMHQMGKNPEYVKYTVPLYMTGYMAYHSPESFDEEDLLLIEQLMTLEEWQNAHRDNPYLADAVSRSWGAWPMQVNIKLVDDAMGMQIVKLNLRLFLKAPCSYLLGYSKITSILWQINRPADAYQWTSFKIYKAEDYPELSERNLAPRSSFISSYLDSHLGFFTKGPLHTVYCRGGLWAFLLLFEAVIIMKKGQKKMLLSLTAPGIIFALLFLSVPAQDVRFTLPFLECGMLFAVISIFISDIIHP